MLKFEFDEEKQKIFLNFWKIKKISDFSKITSNPDLYFLRFCLLNDVAFSWLGRIIAAKIASENWNIKEYPPFSKTEKNQSPPDYDIKEIIEMLDSIHLINLWQGNSNNQPSHVLNSNNDDKYLSLSKYHLTEEFESCFKALARPPFFPNLKNETTLGSLSNDDKKTLSHFLEYYGFVNNQILLHHSEESLLRLKNKGYIGFFFVSQSWIPGVVINPQVFSQFVKKKPLLKKSKNKEESHQIYPFPRESIAESLFFLQILEYEQVGMDSLAKYYPTSQEKKSFLINIFQQLSELSEKSIATYHSLSFPNKILFLFKKLSPSNFSTSTPLGPLGYRLLEIIFADSEDLILKSLEKGMSDQEITYEVNRCSFISNPTGQEFFSLETVKEILHNWLLLGLVVKNQKLFYGDRNLLEELKEILTVNKSKVEKNLHPIIIDSDYTLVATKEQIRSKDIFFLYHFCDLKISLHLVRGKLSPEKSSLAWYYRLDRQKLLDFFQNCSKSTLNHFQEMLEMYFEHTPYFRVEGTIRITTPSKNFFLILKYFLVDHGFEDQVTTIEEKKLFIFHNQEVFDKVKEAFPDPVPVKFFEKK